MIQKDANRMAVWRSTIVGLLYVLPSSHALAGDSFKPELVAFFEQKVRPLLVERCHECHGQEKPKGNLNLATRKGVLLGGDSGPAVVEGKPSDSLLVKAIEYHGDVQMPPDGKLPDGEIAILKQWVSMGAPWGASSAEGRPAEKIQPAGWTKDQRQWWSFQPLRPLGPPSVKGTENCRGPIDRFIQSELEQAGFEPFPPADKRVLIRRATFDLTGLPPTPDEIDAFVNDDSAEAFSKVVDRLLTSPHYGERWGRRWLDLVRYADYIEDKPGSHGSAAKFELFEAWRYRDWVVRSFNSNLSYDQFVMHQIAGDKVASPTRDSPYADGLVATTMLAIGAWDNGDADKDKVVSDIVDDQINVVGQAFLGLTLACARCHDHKFDPISTADYYALAGIFHSTKILEHVGTKGDHTVLLRTPMAPAAVVAKRKGQLDELARITAMIAKAQPPAASMPNQSAANVSPTKPVALSAETTALIAKWKAEQAKLEKELLPAPPLAIAAQDGGTPGGIFPGVQDVPIHIRGSYTKLGPVVARRLPEFFAGSNQPPIKDGSGRLELARWTADANHPLTARVMVNRIWQGHFGEGLVRTPSNFGKLGERPTHPELLDWLAIAFIQSGWSVKAMHRQIMNSAAYQRASVVATDRPNLPSLLTGDPENRLLARFSPRRLDAEEIRDALLATTGRLDSTLGGPANGDLAGRRRSLYVQTTRSSRAYFSSLFDSADPEQSVEKRMSATIAPQALFFLNHPFVSSRAAELANRLCLDPDRSRRLRRAYALLFGRSPNKEEAAIALEFLERNRMKGETSAWSDFARILLSSNEFTYVD